MKNTQAVGLVYWTWDGIAGHGTAAVVEMFMEMFIFL